MRFATIVTISVLAVRCLAAPPDPVFTATDIRLLSRAIALIDYPVSQAQFRVLTGFQHASPVGVYAEDNTGAARDVLLYSLSKDAADGRYHLRISLSSARKGAPDKSPQVEVSAIVYTSSVGTFVLDPDTFPLSIVPYLKTLRRDSGLSIREFVESPNWMLNVDKALSLANAKARQAVTQPSINFEVRQ